jgi:hypothetical protein
LAHLVSQLPETPVSKRMISWPVIQPKAPIHVNKAMVAGFSAGVAGKYRRFVQIALSQW